MHDSVSEEAVRRALADAGIADWPERKAETEADAREAVRRFGYPVWLRSVGTADPCFCAELHTDDDLPLALRQAEKRCDGAPPFIQPVPQGDVFRFGGGVAARMLFPEAGIYRLAVSLSTDPDDAEAQAVADLLPPQGWQAECARTATGWRLLRLWPVLQIAPALQVLGQCPQAGAVCWVSSRSGRVTSLEGIAMPQDWDTVAVRPGDQLQHVLDEQARDRLGFVWRAAPTAPLALMRAREACDAIRIHTTALLD